MVDSNIWCNDFCFDYRRTNIGLLHVSNIRNSHETTFNLSRGTRGNLPCTHRSVKRDINPIQPSPLNFSRPTGRTADWNPNWLQIPTRKNSRGTRNTLSTAPHAPPVAPVVQEITPLHEAPTKNSQASGLLCRKCAGQENGSAVPSTRPHTSPGKSFPARPIRGPSSSALPQPQQEREEQSRRVKIRIPKDPHPHPRVRFLCPFKRRTVF
jgi:hypothetical protein